MENPHKAETLSYMFWLVAFLIYLSPATAWTSHASLWKDTSRAVLCDPVLHTQRKWLDKELLRVSLKDILNIVLRMNTDIAMIWFHHLALYLLHK